MTNSFKIEYNPKYRDYLVIAKKSRGTYAVRLTVFFPMLLFLIFAFFKDTIALVIVNLSFSAFFLIIFLCYPYILAASILIFTKKDNGGKTPDEYIIFSDMIYCHSSIKKNPATKIFKYSEVVLIEEYKNLYMLYMKTNTPYVLQVKKDKFTEGDSKSFELYIKDMCKSASFIIKK